MKLRTLLFLGVAGLAAATVSAQTYGGTESQPQTLEGTQTTEKTPGLNVSGTVVSTGGGTLVLDTDGGQRTFVVDESSNLPSNVAAGSRIDVRYHELADGRLHLGSATIVETTDTGQTPTTDQTTAMGTPLRASGTVVSSSSTELVLDTPSGQQTFKVDGSSRLPGGLTVGSQVDVTYHDMNGMLHLGEATVTTAAEPSAPSTTAAATGDPVTVTGTVVSSTPTQLVIRTDTGSRTFAVGEDARVPIGLQADDRVTIEYETEGDGTLRAMNVTTLGADAPTQTAELPRTASDLPLVGLIGLLALAGALALRTMRRHTS